TTSSPCSGCIASVTKSTKATPMSITSSATTISGCGRRNKPARSPDEKGPGVRQLQAPCFCLADRRISPEVHPREIRNRLGNRCRFVKTHPEQRMAHGHLVSVAQFPLGKRAHDVVAWPPAQFFAIDERPVETSQVADPDMGQLDQEHTMVAG